MKVRGVKKTGSTAKKKVHNQNAPIAFNEIMAVTEEKREQSHLDDMLDDIREKGKELSDKKEVEILLAYKGMVKSFIEEAVTFGLKVVERRGHGRSGRSKIMRLVSMIDEKMIDMTENLLKEENASIKLLGKIGEIEGLLLNIYA